MDETMKEKYDLIKAEVKKSRSKDPVALAKSVMHRDSISLHGPEHHFLDGAAFLAAYQNAGGEVDLDGALSELAARTEKMPGAMCGYWGICGSAASVGAALSVLHRTSPLSDDQYYQHNMEFTASVTAAMSQIGGPRCCKRNAFLALSIASRFVREKYGIDMECNPPVCEFTGLNPQCIRSRCPFFRPQE